MLIRLVIFKFCSNGHVTFFFFRVILELLAVAVISKFFAIIVCEKPIIHFGKKKAVSLCSL